MIPSLWRSNSCAPQKHPPARTARSVLVVMMRSPCLDTPYIRTVEAKCYIRSRIWERGSVEDFARHELREPPFVGLAQLGDRHRTRFAQLQLRATGIADPRREYAGVG